MFCGSRTHPNLDMSARGRTSISRHCGSKRVILREFAIETENTGAIQPSQANCCAVATLLWLFGYAQRRVLFCR